MYDKMVRKCPTHGLKENEILDIFYNGLTENTRAYLDSIAGNVFGERTVDEATELLRTISKNYDDWNTDEIFPEKRGGMINLDGGNGGSLKGHEREGGFTPSLGGGMIRWLGNVLPMASKRMKYLIYSKLD